MARTGTAACIVLVVVAAATLFVRPAMAQETAKITVVVYNRSTMQASVLVAGQSVGQKILREADLESTWINCPVPSTQEANPQCREASNHPKLILTIVPRWTGPQPGSDAMCLAVGWRIDSVRTVMFSKNAWSNLLLPSMSAQGPCSVRPSGMRSAIC